MKKKILGIALVITMAMLTLPIFSVSAKNNPKFIEVSGQLQVLGGATVTVIPIGNSANVKRLIIGNSLMWTGSFEDSISIADGRWMFHKDHTTAWNIHEMTAEFMGKSGTLTIMTGVGGWKIIGGTGDFENCHGTGTSWPVTPPLLWAYEGVIHFDPE
jgi:hypothetical protein